MANLLDYQSVFLSNSSSTFTYLPLTTSTWSSSTGSGTFMLTTMSPCTCVDCIARSLVQDPPVIDPLTIELFPAELELDVIAQDIALGVPKLPGDCAIARAAKRRFDGAAVAVGGGTIQIWTDPTSYPVIYAPIRMEEMTRFIDRFDRRQPVEPTRFGFIRVR